MPARLRVEWIVEQVLHPRRVEQLGAAIPSALERPRATPGGRPMRRRWPCGDGRTCPVVRRPSGRCRRIRRREPRTVRTSGGRRRIDDPPRRHRTAAIAAAGAHVSVGVLDRQRRVERVLGHGEDAYRRAGRGDAGARQERHRARRTTAARRTRRIGRRGPKRGSREHTQHGKQRRRDRSAAPYMP